MGAADTSQLAHAAQAYVFAPSDVAAMQIYLLVALVVAVVILVVDGVGA